VDAKVKWGGTGINLDHGDHVTVTLVSGSWTANPATGRVGPAGNPGYIAKPGYTLPGAHEGALIGRVGPSGSPFLVVVGTAFVAEAGALFLCINDDLNDRYGVGFADNAGALVLNVTCQRPSRAPKA
jgi:glucose dehydrogenase